MSTAEEMFLKIEKFGRKPRISIYPLQDWIDDCMGDQKRIDSLEHSINYNWQTREEVA
jgi:hypothetical protein